MGSLLQSLGVEITPLDEHTWRVQAKEVRPASLDPDICRSIRASILLAGPMIARSGTLRLPPPGGDVIGRRRVDTHLIAMRGLGTQVDYDRIDRVFDFKASRLQAADILLDEASVTATENAVMAAVTAKGTTILRNAASEPHIQELCTMLNAMGAQIDNIGSNTLHIHGVDRLHAAEFTIGPDYLEVAYRCSGRHASSIRIRNAGPEYLARSAWSSSMGVTWDNDGAGSVVPTQDQ
jgi:UDP-N-acetylglucosamine 1-carboxyvinyltransferase